MKDFIAAYTQKYGDHINKDLFDRTFDRPLVDYIIDTCKNLEVLPAITLKGYEYITDQTKIHSDINKRLVKDPKIKNNKCLERLASPNKSVYDLLVLHFHVSAKGQEEDITRKLRVPKKLGNFYIRGGKKVMPLIQIVDNSTFVKGNILNFKTTLYPIKLYTSRIKLKFVDDEAITVSHFHIDLFDKITNPLYYYLAKYGFEGTLEMFCTERIMSVVPDIIDPDNYLYLKINNHLYLEVHEKGFYAHEFVGKFVGTLYDLLIADKKITIKDIYDQDYWLGRLAEIFSKKRSVNKGERVLISYKKIMDPYTKARLKLKKFHRKNTATVIRWMMVNYEALLQKDSNDLKNKRMRANETQAYFFDSYITRNVYSLLNTDDPPFEKYRRLLNSINEYTLIKSTQGGNGKTSPTSMFRYERYNDFDAIEMSRYTLKGPTGLNGGKKKTSIRYRDIYPSHYGRYDLNVCSSTDPGLTGYLAANVQFDQNGYFDFNNNEPDGYDKTIDKLLDKKSEEDYRQTRDLIIKMELDRGDDGFIKLRKRHTQEEWTEIFNQDPWKYGLYVRDGKLRLIPKQSNRDTKGFIKLVKKSPAKLKSMEDFERDENGFIVLKRVVTKMEQQKIKEEKRKKKKKKE